MRITACLLALLLRRAATGLAQEPIEWSVERRLTKADFKGRVPAGAPNASMSAISIDASWECEGGALVASVRATFDPSRSWWRSCAGGVWGSAGERTSSSQAQQEARRNTLQRDMQLLEHEQLHFDIAEVTVRKIKARFADFKNACAEAGGTDPIQQMVVEADRELQEEQQRYDRETAPRHQRARAGPVEAAADSGAAELTVPRYRFSEFILSPRRRMLLRSGREQPLIPRYFDLLVFLIERRGEAVHRRDIFDRVWSDVVVSDSALSQAIRTIRRVLGDDSREPRFVRTVSRHGYQFVFADVVEEDDDGEWQGADAAPAAPSCSRSEPPSIPYEPLLQRVTRVAASASEEEDQREAAELLHALGTTEALRRLGTAPAPRIRASAPARYALGRRRRPARCRFSGSPRLSRRRAS